jgi:hypothetical protein
MGVEGSDLAARLKTLEARLARLAVASAAVGTALVAIVVWLAVRTPNTLRAERYVLIDSGGRVGRQQN